MGKDTRTRDLNVQGIPEEVHRALTRLKGGSWKKFFETIITLEKEQKILWDDDGLILKGDSYEVLEQIRVDMDLTWEAFLDCIVKALEKEQRVGRCQKFKKEPK